MTQGNLSRRGGMFLLIWCLFLIIVFAVHQWQAGMDEDQRWIDSCHTMGNHACAPGAPWHGITINVGGTADD